MCLSIGDKARVWQIMMDRRLTPTIARGLAPTDMCGLLGLEALQKLMVISRFNKQLLRHIVSCSNCFQRNRQFMMPCGHKFCDLCVHSVRVCPVCKSGVEGGVMVESLHAASDPRTEFVASDSTESDE